MQVHFISHSHKNAVICNEDLRIYCQSDTLNDGHIE